MAPISLADVVSSLPSDESWGPATPSDNSLDGVPYAPFSKGDKLGRMADWTAEGKDGRDRRGGQGYNRGFRGENCTFVGIQEKSWSNESQNPFCQKKKDEMRIQDGAADALEVLGGERPGLRCRHLEPLRGPAR